MNILNATTAFDENPATRAQIAQLIETIGRPDFASTVMEVIGRFLPVAHFAALVQNPKSGVQVIAAASWSRDDTSSAIAHFYAQQYFRNDPARLMDWSDKSAQRVALSHLRSSDLGHSPNRRDCYDKPGIIERLSVTCGSGDSVDSVNFYRTHPRRAGRSMWPTTMLRLRPPPCCCPSSGAIAPSSHRRRRTGPTRLNVFPNASKACLTDLHNARSKSVPGR